MRSIVLVTVSGDSGSVDMQVDTGIPLAELVPGWARRCSSRPAEDLVAVSGHDSAQLRPDLTLADLGLGYGSVIRLVTGETPGQLPDGPTRVGPAVAGDRAAPAPGVASADGGEGHKPPPVWGLPAAPPPSGAPLTGPTSPGPASPWPPASSTVAPSPYTGGPFPFSSPDHPVPPAPDDLAATAGLGPSAGSLGRDVALPATMPGRKRVWTAVKAGLSRKSVAAQPTGAFAVPTHPGAGQRYRSALQSTNRAHNLEVMIRSAPLARCMVVAVVSPKGGPGKTTLTALLGTLLAELRRDPVVALDANPDLGDLEDKLSETPTASARVDDLARWLDGHPAAPPAELWRRLGVGPHGLRYIPTPRPPECSKERMIAAADFELYRGLIARLRDYAGIILVDCGTGLLDPPVRAALEAADQIVLITDSSATTARQVVAASWLLPDATPTWLVANRMPQKGSMLDLDQVVAAIPRLHGVTIVPVPAGGQLAENIVTPSFTWPEAPATWQEPIRELAARLAQNWRSGH